ncbi:MAG: ribbon-helix-helix protein, CopG family [Dehalococcoidia bacterium]|nr:ribbon-helix-helix protein, CopG family [Dehalococcoidia bacterium]
MRTIIDLSDEQLASLRELCEAEGISRAEAVRIAVDMLIARREEAEWQAAKRAAFGIWKDRDFDALDYERELREEWER